MMIDPDLIIKITESIDNAREGGYHEVDTMTDEELAMDLQNYEGDCGDIPLETLVATVREYRRKREVITTKQ